MPQSGYSKFAANAENVNACLLTVFYIFCAALVLQLFYLLFFYARLAWYKPPAKTSEQWPPVSVIICARNEDTNLKKNLPSILNQDYPNFEVIVVDDNSEDGTTEYLFFLSQKEPRLKRVRVGNVNPMMAGKKFPLTLGMKAASNDIVLLTDADCSPASSQWIRYMAAGFAPGKDIVLGYGPFAKQKTPLNRRARFETFFTALHYFSFALAGIPYMGVGRNLAYRKKLFFEHNGFTEHRNIPSGDDDLFINKVARRGNTQICIQAPSFMVSEAEETRSDWREQKKRHLSTARYYRKGHIVLLTLEPLAHFLFWICGILMLATAWDLWYLVAGIMVLRWALMYWIFGRSMRRLGEEDLAGKIAVFDFLQIFYYIRFARAALVKTKYRWN